MVETQLAEAVRDLLRYLVVMVVLVGAVAIAWALLAMVQLRSWHAGRRERSSGAKW